MENREWLKNLKVGDSVMIVRSYLGTTTREVKKIDRITPTRQFVIGNLRFRNDGMLQNNMWSSIRMEEATATTAWSGGRNRRGI